MLQICNDSGVMNIYGFICHCGVFDVLMTRRNDISWNWQRAPSLDNPWWQPPRWGFSSEGGLSRWAGVMLGGPPAPGGLGGGDKWVGREETADREWGPTPPRTQPTRIQIADAAKLKVKAMEVPYVPWKSSFHIVWCFAAYSEILQICIIYTPFAPSDVFLKRTFFAECIFVVWPLGCSVSPSRACDCPTSDIWKYFHQIATPTQPSQY